MGFSKFFIDRPVFAAVLSILVFLGGLLSIFQLPISEYPEVVPPSVVVSTRFPGANPTVIAQYMPGAGGAKAANYVYNAAAKDGTAIGLLLKYIALEQATGRAAVKYDVRKFNDAKMTPVVATRAQTEAMLKAYRAQWAPVVQRSGYQP